MSEELYLKAGQLVNFSCGEYSDYSLRGSYVALVNVTQSEAVSLADDVTQKSKAAEEKAGWYDGDIHSDFEAALIAKGWLIAVDATEHHIGSYGDLEIL